MFYLSDFPSEDDKFIWDMWLSSYRLATMTVSEEIGIFRALNGNMLSTDELAERLGIDINAAQALSDMLISMNLLKKDGKKLFLTAESKTYLINESPFYRGKSLAINRERYPHTALLKAVRGHRNPFNFRESMQPEFTNNFMNIMHDMTLSPTIAALKNGIFDQVSRLLDVGGGSGCAAVYFIKKYPEREAGIFDFPAISNSMIDYIKKYDVEDKVRIYSGHCFKEPIPEGYDGLCFNNVFHDIPSEYCIESAKSAYSALMFGGSIFIHEMLLDENKTSPMTIAAYSIAKFTKLGSQQFSFRDIYEILSDAGFSEITVRPTFGYFSMIIAKKV